MIGAVDIGGTKIAVGMVNDSGELSRKETPTDTESYANGLAAIASMLRETARTAGVEFIRARLTRNQTRRQGTRKPERNRTLGMRYLYPSSPASVHDLTGISTSRNVEHGEDVSVYHVAAPLCRLMQKRPCVVWKIKSVDSVLSLPLQKTTR